MNTKTLGIVYPPKKRPEGWLLAHNRVLHTLNSRMGTNGFRYFYVPAGDQKWVKCDCGWRKDLGDHYRAFNADPGLIARERWTITK